MPLPAKLTKKVGDLTKKKPAWLTGKSLFWGAITLSGIAILIALYIFDPGSTETTSTKKDSQGKVLEITTTTTPQDAKNIWDWVGLLGVPIALTAFGWFEQSREKQQTLAEKKIAEQKVLVEKEVAEQKALVEKGIAEQQAKTEKEIAESNQREEALQNYLDRLSDLLIDKNVVALTTKVPRETGEEKLLAAASDVIQARTVSLLRRLGNDGERKGHILTFLIASEVIGKLKLHVEDFDFSGANLKGANLKGVNLSGGNFSGANFSNTDLEGANLSGANFSRADLTKTGLNGVNLSKANLSKANLSKANLSEANFEGANLAGANLTETSPIKANFRGSNLEDVNLNSAALNSANLSNTDLTCADFSNADLSEASLEGAKITDVCFSSTKLAGANLTGVRGWTEKQLGKAELWETTLPEGCKLSPY